VPVKPFEQAKVRLAPVLEPPARRALSRKMLEQTLDVLAHARGIDRIAVVSRDDEVLRLAQDHKAWAIKELGSGLNDALEEATAAARARGLGAGLIVPTDLPNLEPRDVEQMIELGQTPPCVVIARAQRDGGTNALLVHPLGLIEYAFGKSSAREHRRRGEAAGARVEICDADAFAFDLDLPEDARVLGYTI